MDQTNMFYNVVSPIVDLLNSVMNPLLAIVGALGALYCVILGVKFAKADEPQEREKAKVALKNAVIGFALIFILMFALKMLTPIMSNWVQVNSKKSIENNKPTTSSSTPSTSSSSSSTSSRSWIIVEEGGELAA